MVLNPQVLDILFQKQDPTVEWWGGWGRKLGEMRWTAARKTLTRGR